MALQRLLEQGHVEASAPCRIDMGGTLDLTTFYWPLRHLNPCTFNIALDLRTHVRLSAFEKGRLKVSSHGFDSVETSLDQAAYNAPVGLMLAVAACFQADGVHIQIQSTSPPRSALGGSSVAAVALVWALAKLMARNGAPLPKPSEVAMTAHAIEQSVAGVPCGMQDQLAAVYGGIHAWHWQTHPGESPFQRQAIVPDGSLEALEQRLLVAYCGQPHASKDVNATWVRQFVEGRHRHVWQQIVECSQRFIKAFKEGDYGSAQEAMNQETRLRCQLTPEVLDEVGKQLVAAAQSRQCGARFTGAGGGGCVWALGDPQHMAQLRSDWECILNQRPTADILSARIDRQGLL